MMDKFTDVCLLVILLFSTATIVAYSCLFVGIVFGLIEVTP